MPDDLHWSKWPSYTTWLSGFLLFTVLYLFSPNIYLIDKNVLDIGPVVAISSALGFLAAGWIVYDLLCRSLGGRDRLLGICVGGFVLIAAWLACHVFAGRAAFLIVGAMLATIMSANVFVVIIPGQRKMVDAMLKGDVPNPVYGKRGKQRSVHNTYFTLPVVFAMLSNHYAMTYTHPHNWAVLAVIMLAGALIRQFFVMRHRGQVLWYLPLAGVALMFVALILTMPKPVVARVEAANLQADAVRLAVPLGPTNPTNPTNPTGAANPANPVKVADIVPVLQQRCVACHSAHPTLMGSAPAGVMFDTPEEISRNAQRIYQQTVTLKAMPLGNITHMTDGERRTIAAWFERGAMQ